MCRFQLRCVMRQPLTTYPGAEVYAAMRLEAHARQSYDIYATLGIKSIDPQGIDQQVLLASSNCTRALQKHLCNDRPHDTLHLMHLQSITPGHGKPPACFVQVSGKFDLKEPYYRQLTGSWWQPTPAQAAENLPSDLPCCI